MKKCKKIFLFLVVYPIVFACIGDFCQKKTKGFGLQKIYTFPSSAPKKNLFSEEIQNILSQPFFFLKKGQQCFVFLSQDKKTVIKFLRADKIDVPLWADYCPSNWTTRLQQDRKRKKELDFASYKIAYTELAQETGILYLQLGEEPFSIDKEIEIYDNLGIKHTLSCKNIAFILQKRTNNFYPDFLQSLKHKNEEQQGSFVRPFLSSLASLLQDRAKKGISDSDISLEYNMGVDQFLGTPVLFDIGNLTKKTTVDLLEEARLIVRCLEEKDPTLASFFIAELLNEDGK